MTDRKRYSKRREERLYRLVYDEIMELRIKVLRGAMMRKIGEQAQESTLYELTKDLPEKVAAEYRRSYAPAALQEGK